MITAPSLVETENVSGISTLVRQIIAYCDVEFAHFVAGRKDGEKAGAVWILKQLLLPFRLLRIVASEKVDIVHINTAFVPLSICRDAVLTFTARLLGRPVLLHPNGGRFLFEKIENKTLEWLTTKMLRSASIILVLSEIERQSLIARWPDLEIGILPNAIEIDKARDSERPGDKKTIIFLGRIHESKGLHEIIKACGALKSEGIDFKFRCFGAGPMKDFFTKEMKALLGDSFSYEGVVSGQDKWKALSESDIFVLPSRYGEGLPLAMLEAMASKCVVVVGDVASAQTVIEDGVNGFIVEPSNVVQLIEKLKFLLSNEADWESLTNNARKTIEDRFSIMDYVEELKMIYDKIKG